MTTNDNKSADEVEILKIIAEYTADAHAMQSGVAVMMNYDQSHSPKHLRTGVNSAMSDVGALAYLLIAKGIFTELEYVKAVRDSMKREKEKYEHLISQATGKSVKLM